jgi:hypothetical protein
MADLNIDNWLDIYTPKRNHIDENAGFDLGTGHGSMFETFGEELDFVREFGKENPKKVWTIIDGDGEDLCLIAGYHFVNRLGYILSEEDALDEHLEKDFLFD